MSLAPKRATEQASDERPSLRIMTMRRVAIVLFNLGGPDSLAAVQPFLFNLFNDRAIIGAPQPLRFLLAQLISRLRAPVAKKNYALMGGCSPLLAETQKQARTLELAISGRITNVTFKCFPAMRYWRPSVRDAAREAEDWGATDAVLLPLYPQFSSTTTGSSLAAWGAASQLPCSTICCYPAGAAFAQAHADAILDAWRAAGTPPRPRVLFSAHGLPQSVIDRGDPYQWQVEQSANAVSRLLPADWEKRVCYQSRVGPMKWIGPSTEREIIQAARDKIGVIVAPIAFVSEHVETLVELDVEYAQLARAQGVPFFVRASTLGIASGFINMLASLVERVIDAPCSIRTETGDRLCPGSWGLCPQGAKH